ncbi:50S ribosomal protein L3 [Candidatus Dojkabacteria bacterium]|nr:50S ribosomal protein L3 [Candidatus Dojkabacteria bacterium]
MDHFIGYKKGMTQVYKGERVVPVTIVEIPENVVVLIKKENNKMLVRLGIGKKKRPNKAEQGMYKDANLVPVDTWDFWSEEEQKAGDKFNAENLGNGDVVKVTAITKSKGFAGVMKRWGFHGGQRTHGQSDRQRAPGSIGAGTDPGRVLPGKKMPGRMGGVRRSFRKRKIMGVGDDYILISGSLPGNVGSLVKIHVTKKNEG